ncbi:partial DNA topoisomerase 1, partial [Anaerolineae bacterium]
MSSLLLVDSPAAAHKLRALVGEGWQVQVAPHVLLELPRNRLGVAVREGFALTYQLPFRHQPTLKRLQKAAATAKEVYLALGDDLSAWMVVETLKLSQETKVNLVKLETLSAEGWPQALAGARPLDPKAVEAAKARRAADRLVSYLLTPLLHKRLAQPLKIDRLGLVMLSLLVNHEARLSAAQAGCSLVARLETPEGSFEATLTHLGGKRVYSFSKAQAAQLVERLSGASFWVKTVLSREQPPAPPLTLASLMAQAEAKWAWAPLRTAAICRILFEASWLTGGETIQPTDPARTPHEDDTLADGAKVYKLIWEQQHQPHTLTQRGVRVEVGAQLGSPFPLEWRAVETKSQPLPPLSDGQVFSGVILEVHSQTPLHFSRGTLLSRLVQGGVGEALTCARALERLESSGLVHLQGRALLPTSLGRKVHERLTVPGGMWMQAQGA